MIASVRLWPMSAVRRLGLAVAPVFALVFALVFAMVGFAPNALPVHADAGMAGGGEYHPLTPARIFDSRSSNGGPIHDVAPLGAKPANGSVPVFNVAILGKGGVPINAGEVLAVAVSITVTEPTALGYLTAFGKGASAGISSINNFKAGQTVANVAIVRPGADGELSVGLFGTPSGSAHVVIDVFGWFSTSSVAAGTGARLIPTSPGRILDTRTALNRTPATTPLASGETLTLPIRGVDAADPAVTNVVPDSATVTGVVLNVTGVSTAATFLAVVPESLGGVEPTTSNVNLAANSVKANLVFAPVGADGSVRIFNLAGPTHVVVDVVGYLQISDNAATRAGRVVPLSTPFRTFDTREATFGNVALGPGQAEDWSFAAFSSSVAIGGTPVGNQLGVIGNLTNASLTRQYATVAVASYLTAWPLGATRPESSNLNTSEGSVVPNLAVFRYGTDSTVKVYNLAGNTHYLFDASAVILND